MYKWKENKMGDIDRAKRLTSADNIVGNILGKKIVDEVQHEVHEAKESKHEEGLEHRKRMCRK